MIDFKGGQIEIQELSRVSGIPWSTIYNRYQAGYRDDDLTVKRLRPTLFKGQETTLEALSQEYGIPLTTLKGRQAAGLKDDLLVKKEHRNKDSENAAVKLTVEKVVEIKRLLLTSTLNQREIAQLFGIDPSHVSDIKRGKRWGKVKVETEEVFAAIKEDQAND